MKFPFLLSLGCHSKQAGDERDLVLDVSLPHTVYLPFANHVHHFVSLQRSLCRFNGKEAHPWLDQPFNEAVVLLHQIIQVFDLPEFDLLGKHTRGFEVSHGLGIGRMLIDIDHTSADLVELGSVAAVGWVN